MMEAISKRDWDVIIIGGGVVGCSAAYYAAKNGMRVLLVERDAPGSAQSGRNLGFVRQQNRDFRELPLMIGALSMWKEIEAELGRRVGWQQGGNLSLAFSEADLVSRRAWQKRAAEEFGLDTRMLSATETHALVPQLATDCGVVGAMYTPSDGKAEPARATRAFFDAALGAGAAFAFGESVTRIETGAGKISGVRIRGRLYRAGTVIVAAGAGSAALLRKAGLDLPQEFVRATVARTVARPESRIAACVSGQHTGIRQDLNGAYLISVAGGEYDLRLDSWRHMRWYEATRKSNPDAARIDYLAPIKRFFPLRTHLPVADFPPSRDNPRPELFRVEQASREFSRLLPTLASLEIETFWAGIIDTMPDVIPVLGPIEGISGMLVGAGFSGHGFGPGPMAGKVLSDLAAGRRSPVDISALSPMRFAKSWTSPKAG
ncbi:FAD-binding oxidoreductase [Mesorhizobium sp. B1-1-4]|uniref:NAD(P)/FAD-dependent oxidoreductase n=1 Tax=unclassified Mesorhizobium TaxID=325217 RepID=UPI00112DA87A|nr:MULTISPECIES: FAD-binding oxidoreductase [unclassified Mesorhizobium]MBZ9918025.1 FAD-binding oxidoreductase [Mesorhizobium sp. BR1-1-7]MBZ9956231.1 FAD-binding oxidoreductase [Mesorhizobium sp. BR1-1-15]MBZ9973209.1 FAD-binding oxidoreductase [Mesorhizobium sp. BR1-1-12]TPN45245.1 FAD-binding oxidoreductase [Mesorhizobium sp. B1-1-4]